MSVYEYEECNCHPWCSDPSRDEFIRAAEDGRSGPLPTLEEAIYRAGTFMPSEAPKGQNCTERDNCAAPAASVNSQGILDSSPAASGAAGMGWLTGDERLAVSGAILILDQHGPTNIGRTLNDILARSSPPEVVIPFVDPALARIVYGRDSEWLAALAAAGVKVKEVVK